MNTTLRSLLSAVTGIALVAFIAHSAVSADIASANTALGIAGLVLWSLAHMLVLDFASTPSRLPVRQAGYARAKVANVVEFPCEVAARDAA